MRRSHLDEQRVVGDFKKFCSTGFGKEVMRHEAGYVRRWLAGAGRVLDVGCGIGQLEADLPDMDITGLDASRAMVSEARRRSGKQYVLGDACRLPFRDGSHDGVVSVTTLEFLEDPRMALAEMWRVSEPGGRVMLLILNPRSDYFRRHFADPSSYFGRVRQTDLGKMRGYVSALFDVQREEFMLGVRGGRVFRTRDERWASIFAMAGQKGARKTISARQPLG